MLIFQAKLYRNITYELCFSKIYARPKWWKKINSSDNGNPHYLGFTWRIFRSCYRASSFHLGHRNQNHKHFSILPVTVSLPLSPRHPETRHIRKVKWPKSCQKPCKWSINMTWHGHIKHFLLWRWLCKQNSTFWMIKAGENMFTEVGRLNTSGQHRSIYKPHFLACFF